MKVEASPDNNESISLRGMLMENLPLDNCVLYVLELIPEITTRTLPSGEPT